MRRSVSTRSEYNITAKHVGADLAKRTDVDNLVVEAKKATSNKIDILINNAGTSAHTAIWDEPKCLDM